MPPYTTGIMFSSEEEMKGPEDIDTLFLPGVIIWLPALKLDQTEETAGNIRLILTGAVDKPSLGHLQRQNSNSCHIMSKNIFLTENSKINIKKLRNFMEVITQ